MLEKDAELKISIYDCLKSLDAIASLESGVRVTIGVVAIGTLGTQALPDKERNLSIRNQKVFMY